MLYSKGGGGAEILCIVGYQGVGGGDIVDVLEEEGLLIERCIIDYR